MRIYRFRGSVTKAGVTFYVEAPDVATAKQRAAKGQWENYEDHAAETIDWEIDTGTCEADD